MFRYKCLVFALFALLAQPASAGWTKTCPGDTADSGTNQVALQPGQRACLRQTTATDPARLDATQCKGGLDLSFQDPTATNYDASAMVYQCSGPGTAGVFTDCKVVPIDRDGDAAGDGLPLTGDEAALQFGLWGLSPDWYAFDVTNGSSRTIELKAMCK